MFARIFFGLEGIKVGSIKKRPTVVCLGAGPSQLVLIEKLKQMGFSVIAVDRNPKAPGFNYCDEKIIQSTYDSGPIIKELKQLSEQYHLVGVINRSSGPPVITTAKINEEFGFPGVPVSSAKAILDKALFMNICTLNGLPVPKTSVLTSIDDFAKQDNVFPFVLKPDLSLVGKGGVFIIEDVNDFEKAFLLSRKAAYHSRVLLQEHIEGNDVTLMAVVTNGELLPILLIDEINDVFNGKFEGKAVVTPSIYSGQKEEKHILQLAKNLVKLFNIENTAFILSCRCSPDDDPKIIELHLDLGGDLIIDELIPACTKGYDVLAYLINHILGKDHNVLSRLEVTPTAVIYERGEGLIRECPFRIITSANRESLQEMIF